MTQYSLKYALLLCMLSPALVWAQDQDREKALALRCEYKYYSPTFQMENVNVAWGPERKDDKAGVQQFKQGVSAENTQVVGERDTGDCVFPSGLQVRAKVEVGTGGPGMCGGDAQAWMSLWINRR